MNQELEKSHGEVFKKIMDKHLYDMSYVAPEAQTERWIQFVCENFLVRDWVEENFLPPTGENISN